MRADTDAGIRDDEVRCAEAADEVLRRGLRRLGVGDVERVGDLRAGQRAADRAARDQAEDGIGRSVVPRERLADAGGGAGDDDALYLPFRTCSTR
jgi:hypothetical protein